MQIIIKESLCDMKDNLTAWKPYEVLTIDDDLPVTSDEYFKIKDDNGKEIWIEDWDCVVISRED